jgi:hypothetical protein
MSRIGTPVANDITGLIFDLDSAEVWRQGAQWNANGGGLNQPDTTKKAHQKIWTYNHDMIAAALTNLIGEGSLPGAPCTIAAVTNALQVTVAGGIVQLEGLWTFDSKVIDLTANTTHYLYLTATRTLVANTSGNTPARAMYVGTVIMGNTQMTSADITGQWVVGGYTSADRLTYDLLGAATIDRDYGLAEKITTKTITGNYTLSNPEAKAGILIFSGTAAADITLPVLAGRRWLIQNKTTQTLTFKRSGQSTGAVAVATLKMARVWCDGTDILRETADAAY